MDGQNENRKQLARLLDEVALQEGIQQTPVEGVRVVRHTEPRPRTPAIAGWPLISVGWSGSRSGV